MVKNSNGTGRKSIPMAVRAAQMSETGAEKQMRHTWEQTHFPYSGRLRWKRCPDCLGRTMVTEDVLKVREANYLDTDTNLASKVTVMEIAKVCDTCNGTGEVPRRMPGNTVDPNSKRQQMLARRRARKEGAR